jgi:hypothetical protein
MDLHVEQRQGFQQLRDEVDAIRFEVVELCSRPGNSTLSVSSPTILDATSSLTPPRQLPNLNSPLKSLEGALDEPDPTNV